MRIVVVRQWVVARAKRLNRSMEFIAAAAERWRGNAIGCAQMNLNGALAGVRRQVFVLGRVACAAGRNCDGPFT